MTKQETNSGMPSGWRPAFLGIHRLNSLYIVEKVSSSFKTRIGYYSQQNILCIIQTYNICTYVCTMQLYIRLWTYKYYHAINKYVYYICDGMIWEKIPWFEERLRTYVFIHVVFIVLLTTAVFLYLLNLSSQNSHTAVRYGTVLCCLISFSSSFHPFHSSKYHQMYSKKH